MQAKLLLALTCVIGLWHDIMLPCFSASFKAGVSAPRRCGLMAGTSQTQILFVSQCTSRHTRWHFLELVRGRVCNDRFIAHWMSGPGQTML
jgi:hypothetical protein